MTREEAIKVLENERACVLNDTCQRSECADCAFVMETKSVISALDLALTALRPVSREQVEKVWSGCEYCTGDVDDRPYLDSKRLYLDKNGILTDEIENIDILRLSFCPVCGKPLSDEAVQMMMERMEEASSE